MATNLKVLEADMTDEMLYYLLELFHEALEKYANVGTKTATFIKRKLDSKFDSAKWQCIIGNSFSGWFTYDEGSYGKVAYDKGTLIVFRSS